MTANSQEFEGSQRPVPVLGTSTLGGAKPRGTRNLRKTLCIALYGITRSLSLAKHGIILSVCRIACGYARDSVSDLMGETACRSSSEE